MVNNFNFTDTWVKIIKSDNTFKYLIIDYINFGCSFELNPVMLKFHDSKCLNTAKKRQHLNVSNITSDYFTFPFL